MKKYLLLLLVVFSFWACKKEEVEVEKKASFISPTEGQTFKIGETVPIQIDRNFDGEFYIYVNWPNGVWALDEDAGAIYNYSANTVDWTISRPQFFDEGTYQLGIGGDYDKVNINVVSDEYINITYPTSSSRLQLGNTYNITWDDNIPEDVKISVWISNSYQNQIIEIANYIPSNGSYQWQVPSHLDIDSDGYDYNVMMTISSVIGGLDGTVNFKIEVN